MRRLSSPIYDHLQGDSQMLLKRRPRSASLRDLAMPDHSEVGSMQMKLRCKEGDVAIIIREEPGCEANVGRLVRVRGPIRADARQGPTWLIDTLDAAPFSYVRKGGVVGETLTSDLNIEHPDTWLQPIRRQRSHANGALKLELEPLPA